MLQRAALTGDGSRSLDKPPEILTCVCPMYERRQRLRQVAQRSCDVSMREGKAGADGADAGGADDAAKRVKGIDSLVQVGLSDCRITQAPVGASQCPGAVRYPVLAAFQRAALIRRHCHLNGAERFVQDDQRLTETVPGGGA